jgi:hypothetical protein
MTGDVLREPAPALSAAGLSDLVAQAWGLTPARISPPPSERDLNAADLFCDVLDEVLQTLAPRVG